ncbi:MAG: ABC transporter permease [Nocardioidaceae bacterium]|nr:ABC transporter permease [Nocardioidaceae bacterium]MBA3799191.1 ABC transporter permease [Geodermatophilaceae bacterium]
MSELATAATAGHTERSGSLWADAWRELYRNPVFVVASVVVLIVMSWAVFPTLWTSTGTDGGTCELVDSRLGPSSEHIFGTTFQGCDMYSHVINGARPSIIIAVLVTLATTLIGVALGVIAGFYGGWLDTVLSRITDVFLGLPFLLGALVFLALLGEQNIWTVSAVLVVLSWPPITRIMRGSVIQVKALDYVEAARALGASNMSIIFRHILPNSIAPVIVLATLYLGGFVSAEATLTFLGVGLQIPEISWGITVAQGQDYAIAGYPHLLIFPCAALIITVLAFIVMGDAMRDALDPRGR